MSKRSDQKIVEDCDHSFELAILLITIMSGTLVSYISSTPEINPPPIIANIRRLSIVFVLPSVLTILAWITIYFIDNETWRMRLRTYAWGSAIFLGLLGVIEFLTICRGNVSGMMWIDPVNFVILISLGLIFPVIPLFLISRILKRYKKALGSIDFFSVRAIVRYTPFGLSYITFWLAFYLAMII